MEYPTRQESQKGNTERKRGYNNGSRSSTNNYSTRKDKETGIKFQLHGQKVRITETYTKELDHIIVKIQSTFDRPINIVKSIRKMKDKSPTEPKWTMVKILKEGTDEIIYDKKFLQQTEDMKFTQEWNSFEKEKKKFLEEWENTYALIYGTFCTHEMRTAVKVHPEFEEKIRDEPLELLKVISLLM